MSKLGDLTLKIPNLGTRLNGFLAELEDNEPAREAFVQDPTRQIFDAFPEVAGGADAVQLSGGNDFLRAALANDDFRNWATDYQNEFISKSKAQPGLSAAEILPRRQVLEDVGLALIRTGDPKLMTEWSSVLLNASNDDEGAVVTNDVAVAVALAVVIVVVVTAIDVTPYTDPNSNVVTTRDFRALADSISTMSKS